MPLRKQTADNRPYKLDLTSKCNKYTLERARRICEDGPTKTAWPSKAFSQLEVTQSTPVGLAYIAV